MKFILELDITTQDYFQIGAALEGIGGSIPPGKPNAGDTMVVTNQATAEPVGFWKVTE